MTGNMEPPEALVALASILVAEQSLEDTLFHVLQLACSAMSGADMGTVTLLEPEGPKTAVSTHEDARQVDLVQYQSPQGGPCLDAYRRQEVVRVGNMASEERWPDFCNKSVQMGILSSLSMPLVVAGDGLGALNIYSHRVDGFTGADEAVGDVFSAHASVALANSRVYWRAQALAGQLEEALATRGVIEQAKGILMASRGYSADEAFEALVQASQRSHIKLHDVAGQLVQRARTRARQGPGAQK